MCFGRVVAALYLEGHPESDITSNKRSHTTAYCSSVPLALARVLLIRLENALGHASLPVCGLGAPVGAHLLIELLQADLVCKRERAIRVWA